jgi:putative flippase GtrA
VKNLRPVAGEGIRYLAASALALGVDFGLYVALIRLAEVNYLAAAPIGFACGLAAVYLLSVGWVFGYRRLADRRAEFAVFAAIGLVGMAINQGIIYATIQWMPGSYEIAKLISAGMVFCFNFMARKLLLFTRN